MSPTNGNLCGLDTLRQNESQLRCNVTIDIVELSRIGTLI